MWIEALPPFIIIAGCITVTGIGLGIVDRWAHRGKVRLEAGMCYVDVL